MASSQECYPKHMIVQRLNSRGACYMEQGEYGKAANALVRALRVWDSMDEDEQRDSLSCSIDDCIILSTPLLAHQLRLHHETDESPDGTKPAGHRNKTERFIYQHPIVTVGHPWHKNQTSGDCWKSRQAPSNTLSLIVLLNLAMAHHLRAAQVKCGSRRRRLLQRVLYLYGRAHQIQLQAGILSPHATMIITNNVGEIHRAVHNFAKHEMCLRHLLSTMMCMVIDNHRRQAQTSTPAEEWDGFLRNISELVLTDNCAGAA